MAGLLVAALVLLGPLALIFWFSGSIRSVGLLETIKRASAGTLQGIPNLAGSLIGKAFLGGKLFLRFLSRLLPKSAFLHSLTHQNHGRTTEEWKRYIADADARTQRFILSKTSHQSFSLTPEEYLSILKEIREVIKEDPAASTYWAQRDELERALKQEKSG